MCCEKIQDAPKFVLYSLVAFIVLPTLSPQETASPPLYYVIPLIFPAIFTFLSNRKYKTDRSIIFLMLFCIIAFLASILSNYNTSVTNVFKLCIYTFIYVVFTSFSFSVSDFRKVVFSYVFISCLIAVLIILSYIYGYPHTESNYFLGRYSIGITGLYKNPNYLTAFINVAFFLVLYYILNSDSSLRKRFLLIAIIALFIVSEYLSGTRAALLTAGIITVLCMFISKHNGARKRVLFIVLLIFIVLLLYHEDIIALIDYFVGKRDIADDRGREIAWNIAFSIIEDNPFLGNGPGCWSNFAQVGGIDYLHNIYLEIILDTGIIGFLVFICIYLFHVYIVPKTDLSFVLVFMFATSFPLIFQNGTYEANLWRCLIINRIVIELSIRTRGFTNKFIFN